MQTIKKIFLALTIITVIGLYFIKQPKISQISDKKTLIIGTAGGYAPFVSVNQYGEYEGFDIDIAKALAKDMEMNLEIKDLGSLSSLFIALEQGKIDAIIWALSITQDRLKKVAMIRYQGEDTKSFSLIFWETIPNNAKNIIDLKGTTICTEIGSCQEGIINKYHFINKLPINTIDEALLNIQYKKADGAIVEAAIAKKFQAKYPQIKILELPLADEDQIEGIGIAIKKENTALIEKINKSVKNLEERKVVTTLEAQWNIAS
jgi:polar amino acid transport system substrate-binding protein